MSDKEITEMTETLKDYVRHKPNCELEKQPIWRCGICKLPTSWEHCQDCKKTGVVVLAPWRCTCGLSSALAGIACPPLPDGPVGDLLAYGEQEKETARVGKDREQYQFWGGWCAALERVASPSPQEQGEKKS